MLIDKYGKENLVSSIDQVEEGDLVTYVCPEKKIIIQSEVLGLLEPRLETIIVCRDLKTELADLVDITETQVFIVFKQNSMGNKLNPCECGAHHTSNPNFHLNYCPMVNRDHLVKEKNYAP
jgi:hypothetical protein